MREAEYGGVAIMVPREVRRELHGRLLAAGLSQQQVADTTGVALQTVNNDKSKNGNHPLPATRTNALGRERPTTYKKSPEKRRDPRLALTEEFAKTVSPAGPPRLRCEGATPWGSHPGW